INHEQTWSERFLAFVQRLDARSNSFPSMHTSVAMLTALYLQPHFGAWVFGFPALIGLSCLFTKQHYLVDLPAGAALGWLAYRVCALAGGGRTHAPARARRSPVGGSGGRAGRARAVSGARAWRRRTGRLRPVPGRLRANAPQGDGVRGVPLRAG